MTLREAYNILYTHQQWRIGHEDVPATNPKQLSEAIIVILKFAYQHLKADYDKLLKDEL